MDARVELDSVVIDRPIREVFSFLIDMENSPLWGRTESTIGNSEGPVSVGSRFTEVAAADEGEVEKETVITGLEPPTSYSYTSRYENGIEERAVVTLEELAGRTRVQPTAEIHLPGIPQEQESIIASQMRSGVSALLANLKTYLDAID